MTHANLEAVARAIFDSCQKEGIEDICSSETWEHITEVGRDIYRRVAQAAINAMVAE